MVVVRVRGLNRVRSKGRIYIYHRATGERITAEPGTPEFIARVAELDAKAKAAPDAVPGTLGQVWTEYRKSPFWTALKPDTRVSYERAIAVMKPLDQAALVTIKAGFVAKLRDRVAATRGRWMANYVLTVLAIGMDFAREREWVDENPVRGVRRLPRPKGEARNRPWTPAECRAALDAAEPYLKVTLALGMCAGFRKRDALTMPKTAIDSDTIEASTSKRGRRVKIPLHPALRAALAEAPKHKAPTISANSRGEPWTESGFNSTFGKFVDALEAAGKVGPGLTFHGLRHTVGTRLKEAGADDRAIADILGQSSTAMAAHYSRQADTSKRDAALIDATDIFGTKAGRGSAKRSAKP